MQIKCQCCYAKYDYLMILEDEYERELLQLMNKLGRPLAYYLCVYVSLFKSPKREIPPEKELRLTKEVLALSTSQSQLTEGLQKVVDVMREKQASGGFKQLKNHNYLKRVLEDTPRPPVPATGTEIAPVNAPQQPSQARQFTSKTSSGMMRLQSFKDRH